MVFESSFVPAAEGRLDAARARVAEAIELNRLSGYPAYAGYLAAHDGWYARLSGDLEAARRIGREAVEATSPVNHPWWYAIAAGLLAATLVETDDLAEAEALARRGLAMGETATGGGRLRCLAALAALGDEEACTEAIRSLNEVECPPGQAWVTGADVYLCSAAPTCSPPRSSTPGPTSAVRDGEQHQTARGCCPTCPARRGHSRSRTRSAARSAPSLGTGR